MNEVNEATDQSELSISQSHVINANNISAAVPEHV